MTIAAAPIRTRRPSLDVWPIDTGWEVASAPASPATAAMPERLTWLPATVPGTVAGALQAAGQALPDDIDNLDWWFRTRIDIPPAAGGEELVLRIGGIATIDDVMEFLVAGASAVQVGTANFFDPTVSTRLMEQLPAALEQLGVRSVGEVVGTCTT